MSDNEAIVKVGMTIFICALLAYAITRYTELVERRVTTEVTVLNPGIFEGSTTTTTTEYRP